MQAIAATAASPSHTGFSANGISDTTTHYVSVPSRSRAQLLAYRL